MGFLEDLQRKILIADGAMGTLLYANGIDSCYEELNLSKPQQIQNIHELYIQAGANVIQTNTYGANAIKLARYGLDDMVEKINRRAVQLARHAAGRDVYVLGTIGGIRGIKKNIATLDDIVISFSKQLNSLLEEGVDGILLETYYDLEEITTVLKLARKITNLPIVAQVSLHEVGRLQDGTTLNDGLRLLESSGANVIGLNCRLGPHHMIQSLKEVPLFENTYLSCYPNASFLDYDDDRFVYENKASYFESCAREFRNEGVRLLGGCCGTTPLHIKAMADALRGLPPIFNKTVKNQSVVVNMSHSQQKQEQHLHEKNIKRKSLLVELDPPKHLNTTKFFEGAKALKKAGIDAITIADNSLASPRVSNMAIATILKEQYHIRSLVHLTCRDRNLIGLQSHLMGLHTLGLNQVLAVTGDPTKVGDFPGATSVFDVASFELISLIKKMNNGLSFLGKPLGEKTEFSVGAAFNPNVKSIEKAVIRIEKKLKHGADYFISQPVYSEEQIEEIYKATKHLQAPIYIGIMPLTSSRNAEFLHHEIPGIKLSDDTRNRMAFVKDDPLRSYQEGLAIAKSIIDKAFTLFNGIYLITPFMRYDMTVELVTYIRQKEQLQTEREIIHG